MLHPPSGSFFLFGVRGAGKSTCPAAPRTRLSGAGGEVVLGFDRSMLAGLQAIGDLPRVRGRVLLYLGSQRLETDEIEVWPLQVFIHHLAQKKIWPGS